MPNLGAPELIIILLFQVVFIALTAWLAAKKGYSAAVWAILAFFLSWVALIIVAVLPRKAPAPAARLLTRLRSEGRAASRGSGGGASRGTACSMCVRMTRTYVRVNVGRKGIRLLPAAPAGSTVPSSTPLF